MQMFTATDKMLVLATARGTKVQVPSCTKRYKNFKRRKVVSVAEIAAMIRTACSAIISTDYAMTQTTQNSETTS